MIHSCLASPALPPSEGILFVIRDLQTHQLHCEHPGHWSVSILRVTDGSLDISDGGIQKLETYKYSNKKVISAYLHLRTA